MSSKIDRKDIGAYTAREASHYLHIPDSTLRAWAYGQSQGEKRSFRPVIILPEKSERLLSFNNLVELHVLEAMRRQHNIPLPRVRTSLDFVKRTMSVDRPLLHQDFETDGYSLFVQRAEELMNVSQTGQLVISEAIRQFLRRIDRNLEGIPIRLFPFTRHAGSQEVRTIVIDPEIAFGRPVLVGTGVPTANIYDRFLAGEPTSDLAHDFRVDVAAIEEAIRCEQVQHRVA